MRLVAFALALAGCSFQQGKLMGGGDDGGGSDGGGGSDSLGSDGSQSVPFCDPSNAALAACYELDGNALDKSQYGNHATASAIAFVTGKRGSALMSTGVSSVHVAEAQSLDVDQLTMELWIQPDQLPVGTARVGILDNDSQYSIFIYSDGVECFPVSTATGGGGAEYVILRAGSLPLAQWTHLACTYDGSTLYMYINGVVVASRAGTGPVRHTGTAGTQIAGNNATGDRLVGAIDDLRIWRTVRTPEQICAAAGC